MINLKSLLSLIRIIRRMPMLTFLLMFLQVVVHLFKRPNDSILILQFDPLRRHEPWRYFTPALIHYGCGDYDDLDTGFDARFWLNISCQFFMGWGLEKMLKWKLTLVVYLYSIFFGVLASSALHPCSFLVGGSAGSWGFITATLCGHLVVRPRYCTKLRSWNTTWIVIFFVHMQPHFHVWSPENFGGLLGGLLIGVIVYYYNSPLQRLRRKRSLVKYHCCFSITVFGVIGIGINTAYALKLLKAPYEIDNEMLNRLRPHGIQYYKEYATERCELYVLHGGRVH